MGKLYRLGAEEDQDQRFQRLNPHIVVGDRIRQIREDRELYQRDVADRMNRLLIANGAIGLPKYEQCALSNVERGNRSLSFLEGLALCESLGIHPFALAPWNDMRQYNPWLPARRNHDQSLC